MNKSDFFFLIILTISAQISMLNALSLSKKLNLKSKTQTNINSYSRMISKITATITTKQAEEIEQFLHNTQQFNLETEREFKRLDTNKDDSLDYNEARKGLNDLSKS